MASRLVVSLKKLKPLSGSYVKLLCPAKLNLYLNIVGRYRGGFHRLESVTEKIDLCDTLEIIVNPIDNDTSNGIIFFGSNRFICNREDLQTDTNLCVKAAKLMIVAFNLKHTFTIKLTKRIPAGAGLGGGSSDAAAVITGIKELLNLKISQKKLYSLGARLGSDVNLFLSESSYAFIQGRGEIVASLPYMTKLRHLIIWPNVFLSTKDVYARHKIESTESLDNVDMVTRSIQQNDIRLLRCSIFNALEKNALYLCRPMRRVKDFFLAQGISMRVTGSGSALYAVIEPDFRAVLLKNMPKHWRVFDVRTF